MSKAIKEVFDQLLNLASKYKHMTHAIVLKKYSGFMLQVLLTLRVHLLNELFSLLNTGRVGRLL